MIKITSGLQSDLEPDENNGTANDNNGKCLPQKMVLNGTKC